MAEFHCCRCFLPIEYGDAVDYLGDCVAHKHERCIQLLRALVEKRERQIVWMAYNFSHTTPGRFGRTELHYVAPDDYPESRTFDGTDAGLLAAIDEATGEK